MAKENFPNMKDLTLYNLMESLVKDVQTLWPQFKKEIDGERNLCNVIADKHKLSAIDDEYPDWLKYVVWGTKTDMETETRRKRREHTDMMWDSDHRG